MKDDPSKDELIVSGNTLQYFIVAYNEFSKEQSNLGDFRVFFENTHENENQIKITFVPNFAPNEKILGGRTSLGRSVTYILSKEPIDIIDWNYHR